MSTRIPRPSWTLTTSCSWEERLTVWGRMALGETDSRIEKWLVKHHDHLDRGTIRDLRRELASLPEGLSKTLPENIQIYWRQLVGAVEQLKPSTQSTPQRHNALSIEREQRHEENLLTGLQSLSRGHLGIHLHRWWSWSSSIPARIDINRAQLQIDLPDTLQVRTLQSHLSPGDPLLTGYAASGTALLEYMQLCGDLYGDLVTLALGLSLPLLSKRDSYVEALTTGFVDSLFEIAGNLVLGDDYTRIAYSRVPAGGGTPFPQLWFGSQTIAIAEDPHLDQAEANHQGLVTQLEDSALVDKVKRARASYEELTKAHNYLIEVRVQQRVFLPGPCEICEAWSGL